MAIDWQNTPLLSQVQLGGQTYYLKDAEARQIIETLSSMALEVKIYESLPTASADTMRYLALVAEAGSVAGTYVEYVTIRSGEEGAYTYAWEKIGTTATDLSEYAKTEDLGDLAFKDTATGNITASSINLENGTTTAEGSINVTLKDAAADTSIASSGKFTPSGNITGDAALSSTDVSHTGTAAAQAFTGEKYAVNVTPTTDSVNIVSAALASAALDGTQSYTAPVLTPASATITAAQGTFATEGLTASVTSGTEILVFGTASTGTVDASKVTNFDGGSLTDGAVNFGALTTTAATATATTIVQGIQSAGLVKDSANGVQIEGANAPSTATIGCKEYAFDATALKFTGTEDDVDVTGTYKKQEVDVHTFTGSASAVTGTVTAAGAQSVTVQ